MGNVLLCTLARKQNATDTVNNTGDFEVWSSPEQVTARVAEIKAADASAGGAIGIPSPMGKAGFIISIDNVKRSELHHMSSNWEGLLGAAPSSVPNPLIGKVLETSLPVTISSGTSTGATAVRLCKCTVNSVDTVNNTANITARHADIADQAMDLPLFLVQGLLAAVPGASRWWRACG